jgi:hypothetical protein
MAFSKVLRHVQGGHLRWGQAYDFQMVEAGLLVMMGSDRRITVARRYMVYLRRKRFMFCRGGRMIMNVRMFRCYPDSDIAGAGEVLPGSRIARRTTSFGVFHYHFLRKF